MSKKKDPRVIFGNNLRKIRTSKGISQEKFAYQADLDRSYTGQIERGERNIGILKIFQIAKALDIEPSELLKAQ